MNARHARTPAAGAPAMESLERRLLLDAGAWTSPYDDAQPLAGALEAAPLGAPLPGVTILDATVIEPAQGRTTVVLFTLILSAPSDIPVRVDYATSDGTARAGLDYVEAAGSVTFQARQTAVVIPVTILGDGLYEGTETFDLNLLGVSGAVLDRTQALGTILDSDLPPLLTFEDASILEGRSGSTWMQFTLRLDHVSELPAAVRYTTADASAVGGVDYVAATGIVEFPPGQTVATVAIEILGDTVPQPDQTFRLVFSQGENLDLCGGEAIGTILSDDLLSLYRHDWWIPQGATVSLAPVVAGGPTDTLTLSFRNDSWATITLLPSSAELEHFQIGPFSRLTLQPGQTAEFSVTLTESAATTPAVYTEAFEIRSAIGQTYSYLLSAEVLTGVSFELLPGQPVRIAGEGGDVRVVLRGDGHGTAWRDGAGRLHLDLRETTHRSVVRIDAVQREAIIELGQVTVQGDLRALLAPAVRLTGLVDLSSTTPSRLMVEGVHGGRILIGGSHASRPVQLRLGRVHDLVLHSLAPVRAVQVTHWTNTPDRPDWSPAIAYEPADLRAPWIGQLTSAGDWQASIVLAPAGLSARLAVLRSAAIQGTLDASAWVLPGGAGQIRAGTIGESWRLTSDGAVNQLRTRDDLGGDIQAASLGAVRAGGTLSAALTADDADARGRSIRLVQADRLAGVHLQAAIGIAQIRTAEATGGLISAGWVGNFHARGDVTIDLSLTSWDGPGGRSLGQARIDGSLVDSLWQVGAAGLVQVRQVVQDSTLLAAGRVGRLVMGAASGSDFFAGMAEGFDPTLRRAMQRQDFRLHAPGSFDLVHVLGLRGQDGPFLDDVNFSASSFGQLVLNHPTTEPQRRVGIWASGARVGPIGQLRIDEPDGGWTIWRPAREGATSPLAHLVIEIL